MRARTYTPYSEIAHCGQPADGLYIIKQVIARVAQGKRIRQKRRGVSETVAMRKRRRRRGGIASRVPTCLAFAFSCMAAYLLELNDFVFRMLIVYDYADNSYRSRRGWRMPQIFADLSFSLCALETAWGNFP